MVSSGDIFLNATDILNAPALYLPIHREVRDIEDDILLAAQAGLLNTIITNTQMTNTTLPTYQPLNNIDLVNNLFTLTNHGFKNGDLVQFNSTGTYPAPVAAGSQYYIIAVDANNFKIAVTQSDVVYNNPIILQGPATGTVSVELISFAQQLYSVWVGQLTDAALTYQMNQVIQHFTNLGYSITQQQNPLVSGIFQWVVDWS